MPRPSPLNESTDAMSLDGLLDSVSCGSFSSPPSPANYLSEYIRNSWKFSYANSLLYTTDKELEKQQHFINWRSRFFIIFADAHCSVYEEIRGIFLHQRKDCIFSQRKKNFTFALLRHWITIFTWEKESLNGWPKTQRGLNEVSDFVGRTRKQIFRLFVPFSRTCQSQTDSEFTFYDHT